MPEIHRCFTGTVITLGTRTPRTTTGWNTNTHRYCWVCYFGAAQCYFQKGKQFIQITVQKKHWMSLSSAVPGWSRHSKNTGAGERRTTSIPSKQFIHLNKSPLTPRMRQRPFHIKGGFKDLCKKWNVQITAFLKAKGVFPAWHCIPRKVLRGAYVSLTIQNNIRLQTQPQNNQAKSVPCQKL